MSFHRWNTASGILFTIAAAVVGGGSSGAGLGCSTTTDSGGGSGSGSGSSGGSSGSGSGVVAPAGCTADGTVSCAPGTDGYSCDAGDNPEVEDPTLSCSTPVASGSEDLYCCYTGFTGDPSTFEPDDGLTQACPDPTSYGYVCASGDDPSSYDASLTCSDSVPDPDGVHDDFCCTYGSTLPAGCTADGTVSCSPGADGYSCDAGDNPEAEDPTLSCSTPVASGSEDLYCCYSGFTGDPSTCEPDDGLTQACPDPTSYGYVCASGDDPTSYDASLTCSDSVPDPDGVHDDFCCTYQ